MRINKQTFGGDLIAAGVPLEGITWSEKEVFFEDSIALEVRERVAKVIEAHDPHAGRKAIGPTFGAELQASGISTDGISWGIDGDLSFTKDVPPERRAAVESLLAAHDPDAQAPAPKTRALQLAEQIAADPDAVEVLMAALTK